MALRIVFNLVFFASLMLTAACAGTAAGAPAVTPTLTAAEAEGKQLFSVHCASCHSTMPGIVIVGPPLAGVARTAGERIPGLDARTYLMTSILSPEDYLVAGFANLMPADVSEALNPEDLEVLVDYLLTLE